MIENFITGVVYPLRTYERHQFCLSIHGKEFKGDYYDQAIHWLHPHPKQQMNEAQMNIIENEIHDQLGNYRIKNDINNIQIEKVFDKSHDPTTAHRFKCIINGEEMKGVCRDDNIDWFHPKPDDTFNDVEIDHLEKHIQGKIKGQM